MAAHASRRGRHSVRRNRLRNHRGILTGVTQQLAASHKFVNRRHTLKQLLDAILTKITVAHLHQGANLVRAGKLGHRHQQHVAGAAAGAHRGLRHTVSHAAVGFTKLLGGGGTIECHTAEDMPKSHRMPNRSHRIFARPS